jgi:peptide-methionine (R)-S-oxide reductase
MNMIPQTEQEWKEKLTPEQYEVLREKGMEIPYTGEYLTLRKKGIYHCAGCATALFSSETKYDFGSGWPCFGKPQEEQLFEFEKDTLLGTEQTGVYCRTCKSHLGHVFEDGPELKGEKRYCINSCALVFKKDKKTK